MILQKSFPFLHNTSENLFAYLECNKDQNVQRQMNWDEANGKKNRKHKMLGALMATLMMLMHEIKNQLVIRVVLRKLGEKNVSGQCLMVLIENECKVSKNKEKASKMDSLTFRKRNMMRN